MEAFNEQMGGIPVRMPLCGPGARPIGVTPESERRSSAREPYPAIQAMATCDEHRLPRPDEFQGIRCHDISAGGMSFLWPAKPDFEEIIVLLGEGSEGFHVRARVVRYQPVAGLKNEHLVCCQFIGRVIIE